MTAVGLAGVVRLVILSAPRTKKTSNQAVLLPSHGKGQPCPHCAKPVIAKVFPSAAWRTWVKEARVLLAGGGEFVKIEGDLYLHPQNGRPAYRWTTETRAVNCRAVFYRDANRGDFIGYAQGLADLLETRGLILNDSQLVTWEGSQLLIDRQNPRVECWLEAIP